MYSVLVPAVDRRCTHAMRFHDLTSWLKKAIPLHVTHRQKVKSIESILSLAFGAAVAVLSIRCAAFHHRSPAIKIKFSRSASFRANVRLCIRCDHIRAVDFLLVSFPSQAIKLRWTIGDTEKYRHRKCSNCIAPIVAADFSSANVVRQFR